jgi:hypothetical protein
MLKEKQYPLYHAKFVYYYILDPKKNATEAMEKARPDLKNRNGAKKAATLILKKPHIKKMIADLEIDIEGTKKDVINKSNKILDELEMVGFFDIRKMFVEGTEERKMLDRLGDDARAISRVKIKRTKYKSDDHLKREEDVEIDVWVHDKMKALELRGKNLKLYTDVMDHNHDVVSPSIYSLPDNGTRRANE